MLAHAISACLCRMPGTYPSSPKEGKERMFKTTNKIATGAIVAGLAFAMGMGGLVATIPSTALAMRSADTGSITFNDVEGQKTSFDGYQLFNADVVDDATSDTGKRESNISWASDAVKTAVETAIKAEDTQYAGTTAQDAADWIYAHVTPTDTAANVASGDYTDATVTKDTVAYHLATALAKAGLKPKTVATGSATTLKAGYWLFVSTADKVSDETSGTDTPVYKKTSDESGSAPVFAVIGGTAVTVTAKAGPVTVDKEVSEDGTNYHHAIDAQKGKDLSYRITGTLPKNYSTFDTYYYEFTDTLGTGLVGDLDSVKVTIDGTDVTAQTTTKTLTNNVLTVKFDDLKKLTGVTITKDSKIVVDYTAHLDPTKAVIGESGNTNDVTLTYTRDPHSDGKGTTTPIENKVFSYGLKLVKLDVNTKRPLAGAKFTIQLTSADGDTENADTIGQYVQKDGSLGAGAYEFASGADGVIAIDGLDAGTYTISETSAPANYTKVDDFTVKITSTIAQDPAAYTNLASTVKTDDADHVISGLQSDNITVDDGKLTAVDGTSVDSNKTVQVTVGDTKTVNLPLTGQAGIAAALIGGSVLVLAGIGANARSRKQSE